jgi:hypothetical protein
VASAESLAGNHGFPADLTAPDDPERIRGAKECRQLPLAWAGEGAAA